MGCGIFEALGIMEAPEEVRPVGWRIRCLLGDNIIYETVVYGPTFAEACLQLEPLIRHSEPLVIKRIEFTEV